MRLINTGRQQLLVERALRNAALASLDLSWARVQAGASGRAPSSDEVLIASMHKARYECTDIAEDLRRQSEAWLKQRGLKRMNGMPWPEGEGLPE